MPTYNYVLVITGQVDAPHDVNAKYQVLMGVTLTARLLQTPHSIAIQLSQEEEAGTQPVTPKKEEED